MHTNNEILNQRNGFVGSPEEKGFEENMHEGAIGWLGIEYLTDDCLFGLRKGFAELGAAPKICCPTDTCFWSFARRAFIASAFTEASRSARAE